MRYKQAQVKAMGSLVTTEKFIEKATLKHGNKYDYSQVEYIDCKTKVTIICKTHGEFTQLPNNHYANNGCHACGIAATSEKIRFSTEEFIALASKRHGNKYDYSLVNYAGTNSGVAIVCQNGHTFYQTPHSHLHGSGCIRCVREDRTSDTNSFISKARKVHGDKFDYSAVEYVHSDTKVKIACKNGHTFHQSPHKHLQGRGCIECSGLQKGDTSSFILRAQKIHGDKFDYSCVEYVSALKKVKLICRNSHVFYQTPNAHLDGHGCKKCQVLFFRSNTDSFISRAKEIHKNAFDYSAVKYVNSYTKVEITCQKGHKFFQKPDSHLAGSGCKECQIAFYRGAECPMWKPERDEKERIVRREPYKMEWNEWRKLVFGRDDFVCQKCHLGKGSLQAHHVLPWSKFPEVRFDIDNGITFCKSCHRKYHSSYKLDECNHKTIAEFLSIHNGAG